MNRVYPTTSSAMLSNPERSVRPRALAVLTASFLVVAREL
jgi:hypothetical protein